MDKISWTYIIAIYLFCAGISGGAFVVSVIARAIDYKKYEKITRIGAYIAPFPIALGSLCLVFDLERPMLFWRLFTSFEAASIMSIGAWLITAFTVFSFLYLFMHLPHSLDYLKIRYLLYKLKLTRFVIASGFLLALSIAIYTGLLISCLPARPFWNTPVITMVFFLSAIIDGIACIVLYLSLSKVYKKTKEHLHFLHTFDFALLVLLILGVSLFLFGLYESTESKRDAFYIINGGSLTLHFWVGFVFIGLIVPFVYDSFALLFHHRTGHSNYSQLLNGFIAALVLAGGYMIRYVVIYAGQMTNAVLY